MNQLPGSSPIDINYIHAEANLFNHVVNLASEFPLISSDGETRNMHAPLLDMNVFDEAVAIGRRRWSRSRKEF